MVLEGLLEMYLQCTLGCQMPSCNLGFTPIAFKALHLKCLSKQLNLSGNETQICVWRTYFLACILVSSFFMGFEYAFINLQRL